MDFFLLVEQILLNFLGINESDNLRDLCKEYITMYWIQNILIFWMSLLLYSHCTQLLIHCTPTVQIDCTALYPTVPHCTEPLYSSVFHLTALYPPYTTVHGTGQQCNQLYTTVQGTDKHGTLLVLLPINIVLFSLFFYYVNKITEILLLSKMQIETKISHCLQEREQASVLYTIINLHARAWFRNFQLYPKNMFSAWWGLGCWVVV